MEEQLSAGQGGPHAGLTPLPLLPQQETPTYVLSLVLLFFLIAASIFKLVIENTKHLLRKYKRDAMLVGLTPAYSLCHKATMATG